MIRILSLPLALMLLAACSRPSAPKIDPITGAPVVELEKIAPAARVAETDDPFLKSQKDVGLTARIEEGRLHLEITNKTSRMFVAGPKNFAVRPAGVRQLIKFDSREAGFPVGEIKPGETRAGRLPLPGGGARLAGGRLFFDHPDCAPAMARIEAGASAAK